MNIPAVQPNFGATAAQPRKEADKKHVNNQNNGIDLGKAAAYTVGGGLAIVAAYKGYNKFFGKSTEAAAEAGSELKNKITEPLNKVKEEIRAFLKDVPKDEQVNALKQTQTEKANAFTAKFDAIKCNKAAKVGDGSKTVETLAGEHIGAEGKLTAFTDAERAVTEKQTALNDAVNGIKDAKEKEGVEKALTTLKEGKNATPEEQTALQTAQDTIDKSAVSGEYKAVKDAEQTRDGLLLNKVDEKGTVTGKMTADETKAELQKQAETAKSNYETALEEHGVKTEYNEMNAADKAVKDAEAKQAEGTEAQSLLDKIEEFFKNK